MNHGMFSTNFGHLARLILVCATVLTLLGVNSAPAAALMPGATITVNVTTDNVTDTNCELRDAILAANTNTIVDGCIAGTTGLDTIAFNISGGGQHTINATSGLPGDVTSPMIIDGTTQPGYTVSGTTIATRMPLIILNGGGFYANAFIFEPGSAGSKLKGFSIVNFTGNISPDDACIHLNGGIVTLEDNWIGTSDGINPAANYGGISIGSSNNRIGGVDASGTSHGNLISGNTNGLYISAGSSNIIQSNYIGVSSSGNASLANSSGIEIYAIAGTVTNTLIGGNKPKLGNVISANVGAGLDIGPGVRNTKVQRNFFGLGADGLSSLGNGNTNIHDFGGIGTRIGGVMPKEGNFISHAPYGIVLGGGSPSTITISGNLIGVDASGSAAGNDVGIGFSAAPATALIKGNLISASTIYGISFSSFVPGALSVSQNCLGGNSIDGMVGLNPLNVSANWWGDASGPSGSGPGSGDPVSGSLIFAPWLTKVPASCLGWAPKSFGPKEQGFFDKKATLTKLKWSKVSTANAYGFELYKNGGSLTGDNGFTSPFITLLSGPLDYGYYDWYSITDTAEGISWNSSWHRFYVTIMTSPGPGASVLHGQTQVTFKWNAFVDTNLIDYTLNTYSTTDCTGPADIGSGLVGGVVTSTTRGPFTPGSHSWKLLPNSDNGQFMPCWVFTPLP